MAEFIDRKQIFPNGVFYVNEQDPQTSLDEIDQIKKMVIHAIYETVLCENYPPQFFAKLKEKINQRFENYKAITNRNKPTERR